MGDIDMRDGFGKDHYTLAGSDVKLMTSHQQQQLRSRNDVRGMTWPAKVQDFQVGARADVTAPLRLWAWLLHA